MQKFRKGDQVKIIAGKDKGKEGEILLVLKKEDKAHKLVIKGVNIVKKHVKNNPAMNIQGGIFEFEKPIDASNAMVILDGKPSRVKFVTEKGKKSRVAVSKANNKTKKTKKS